VDSTHWIGKVVTIENFKKNDVGKGMLWGHSRDRKESMVDRGDENVPHECMHI